jgi:hypothetical protein
MTHAASPALNHETHRNTSMIKKTVRKLQLPRETIRVLSNEHLPNVAGGYTNNPGCSLNDGTGPFPSHGTCTGSIIII